MNYATKLDLTNDEMIHICKCDNCGNEPKIYSREESENTFYICECDNCGYYVAEIEELDAIYKWNKLNLFDTLEKSLNTLSFSHKKDHEKLLQLIEKINRIEFGGVK